MEWLFLGPIVSKNYQRGPMAVGKFSVVEKMVDLWEEASDPRPLSSG